MRTPALSATLPAALTALIFASLCCNSLGYLPVQFAGAWRSLGIVGSSSQLRSTVQTTESTLRELGGYERLLSRKNPGSDKVSLSHGSVFVFDGAVTFEKLIEAVAFCMDRHPMLKAYISKDKDPQKEYWTLCESPSPALATQVTSSSEVPSSSFESAWRKELEAAVNDVSFLDKGPLWRYDQQHFSSDLFLPHKLKSLVTDSGPKKTAWIFCFNHGCDDQQSVNILTNDMLNYIYTTSPDKGEGETIEMNVEKSLKKAMAFPKSVEDAVAPEFLSWVTFKWAVFQMFNQAVNADMLPTSVLKNMRENPAKYTEIYSNPDKRRTFLKYVSLSKEETASLRAVCRVHGVTITNALSAAVLYATSSYFQGVSVSDSSADSGSEGNATVKEKTLRFLLSVGLRPYGVDGREIDSNIPSSDWTGGTVACASGAVDFVVSVPGSRTPYTGEKEGSAEFWNLAKSCREKAKDIIETSNYVPESVRLFGFGMKYADILKVVDLESRNPGTMGRGYSCGVSNVGLVSLPIPSSESALLEIREGYYGTSHARNGVFCLLSTMTVGDRFCGCLQFTSPFISDSDAEHFKEHLLNIITNLQK